jgi:ParB family chromosome partitioning protein
MSEFESNAIFWIEVEKIQPNPYQPRKEFDEHHLRDLAESIRMYGVLQPLVVTRQETERADGGIDVHYELIAGERRLRASKIAGVSKVPAVIRQGTENSRTKLELAIIENLQREDLNPVDRAVAFAQLVNEFGLKHVEVAKKVGKSREYVSNTLRLLVLPQEILNSLSSGKITEGHARTLMMLSDRQAEQSTLFKEIMFKKLTVREAEQVARHIAKDKIRKKIELSPEMERIETELAESLGTRVQIETRQVGGGKVVIDFFSPQDLQVILERLQKEVMNKRMQVPSYISEDTSRSEQMSEISKATPIETVATVTQDQAAPQDIKHTEDINVVLTDANSGKGDDVVPQKHVVEKPATEISAANSLALALGIPLSLIDVVPEKTETMIDVPYDDRPKGEQEEAMEQNDDDGLYAVSSFGI